MADRPIRVLLVADDHVLTRKLLDEIPDRPFVLEEVRTYDEGLAALAADRHDVCLVDDRLGSRTGLELLQEAARQGRPAPVILLTEQSTRETGLAAMRAGAADYLVKGRIDGPNLERSIRYAVERRASADALRAAHAELERRVLERTRELSDANALLAEAARRKDEFLAMLAHELRNPLAPLLNGLHILQRPDADAASRLKAKAMMERQVRHFTRLIDDLLDVSRLKRGKVQLQLERVDLGQLARTAADDIRPMIERAGLRLTVDVPETPVWVQGDPTRLTQVLNNLLENGAKFTDPRGELAVRVRRDPAAGRAALSVRDTGIGIAANVMPRLFDAFAQADQTLERSRGGLGLGLAIVKGLAELHGGEVTAASEGPGRGAEFVVRLPMQSEPAALTEPPAGSSSGAASSGLHILVVEDNEDAAESLRMLLRLYGHEVTVAHTGLEGVRAAGERVPDVVLCDIGLPEMDGYEVAKALRDAPATASVRLIAVTGYGQEEDRRRSKAAGFDYHLVKPLPPRVLQEVLASAR